MLGFILVLLAGAPESPRVPAPAAPVIRPSASPPVHSTPSYRPRRGQSRFVARALSVAYLRYRSCFEDGCRRRERELVRQRVRELQQSDRTDKHLHRLCRQLLSCWSEADLESLMSYLYEVVEFR